MGLLEGLRSSPPLLLALTGLLGLAIGSFLNVVIFRVPKMMERQWWQEARGILRLPARPDRNKITLLSPPSRCPSCGTGIKPWHNVPVLGWIMLRGRCAQCGSPISMQYPIVELACGIASAMCAWRFGWSLQLLPALLLTWSLIALAVIDLNTQLLPDDINLPLLWLGLACSLFPVFASAPAAIVGALAGYLSLWSIYHLFRLVTGKEGMGYGDFKLLAALGAWLGWQLLPVIILLSSLVGATVGIALILFFRHKRETPIPFGPYLAAAGWIALIWGDAIRHAWFHVG